MAQKVQAVLLDVEGTTSSIAFVYDRMFPYAKTALRSYIADHWQSAELQQSLELLAKDAGFSSSAEWFDGDSSHDAQQLVVNFVEQLMDGDSKATGLKSLQGLLWKSGFQSGELQSHLFDDVEPSLRQWNLAGLKLAIYSSGSVTAQRLFFGHTIAGDLNQLFVANFDTTTGPKRNADSYKTIAATLQIDAPKILFLSDIVEELQAASIAGLQTCAVVRPGNKPLPSDYVGPTINSFEELEL